MLCARLQNWQADYERSRSPEIELPQRRALARLFGVPVQQVIKTGESEDKSGVDWLVLDNEGRTLATVDGQHRFAGARKWWRPDERSSVVVPDIPLETSMDVRRNLPGKFTQAVPPKAAYLLQTFDEAPGAYLICCSATWHAVNVSGRLSHIPPRSNRTELPGGLKATGAFLPVPVTTLSSVTARLWFCPPDDE